MRRFLTLVCLLCLAIPAGISITGCTRNPAANYCNGLGYGLKITDLDVITLQPQTTGISMAYGQTRQVASPSASTCKGTSASVGSYTYGTTNNQLVDISPSGNICAGTWNRNTGGGIANYTICSPPNPLPTTGNLPYATAYVTAAASSVTSNPVEVYVHAPVTALTLVGPTKCLSQGQIWSDASGNPLPLDVEAFYATTVNGIPGQAPLCAPTPNAGNLPSCSNAIGTLSYSVGNGSIASINSSNQITANMPGTTLITANVSTTASSAGYFSTCPPASIKVSLSSGATTGTVTQGVTQNLVTTVTDSNGKSIAGLSLDYQSTDPIDISATAGGAISTTYPGIASIYAICQPSSCNPSPINEIGLFGTGLSITSNPVTITTPGTASEYVWYGAPGQSQYFIPVELLTGTLDSTVRLPYVPNSMVMDKTANNLYFGSAHELMIYSAVSNTISKQDTAAPGVVLAVSPDNSQLIVNDQLRQIFYLYSTSGGVEASFGGMGSAAAWTPDSKTLYITDSASLGAGHTDTLYVYNVNTGWSTYDLSTTTGGSTSLAITIPSVGAYLSGSAGFSTVAHTWCPSGIVGNANSMVFYPQGDSVSVQTDTLAATTDGNHILGAAEVGGGITLSDIPVTIPSSTACSVTTTGTGASQVQTLNALNIAHQTPVIKPLTVTATAVNQVVVSPASNLAFVTYTGTASGATLPYYVPATSGAGTVNYLKLTGGASITAPVAGAFSPDNTLFFVSTTGDNKIHYITVPSSASAVPVDSQQISPNLPSCVPVASGGSDVGCTYTGTGSIVAPTVIAVRPRSTT